MWVFCETGHTHLVLYKITKLLVISTSSSLKYKLYFWWWYCCPQQLRNGSQLFSTVSQTSVIHLLLKWHFCCESIHQSAIDLLAAALLHLSIKLSCHITRRLRRFSLYIKPWKQSQPVAMIIPYLLEEKSLVSWYHKAEVIVHHTLTSTPSPTAMSPSADIFNGVITLHILYRSPPERHGSLSPWPGSEANPSTGSCPSFFPMDANIDWPAALRLPYELVPDHLLSVQWGKI